MKPEEIKEVLRLHALWLIGDAQGKYADLQGADLRNADLRNADLQGANLQGAVLQNANLQGAVLQNANLQGAVLQNANLQDTYLRGVNLQGADLQRAFLRGADLRYADLQGADLRGVYLQRADLQHADLQRADLRYADLQGAGLSTLQRAQLSILPSDGQITGWKRLQNGCFAKLLIREGVHKSNAPGGRKCRAQNAYVLEVVDSAGVSIAVGYSMHDPNFAYRACETVSVYNFNPNWWIECAPGIHFFLTKEEAEAYNG